MMGGPEAIVGVFAFTAVAIVGGTLARGIAQRLARGGGGQELDALRDEVEHLRAELDGMHARLGELDELHGRVDFAERMLAQVKEKGGLPPGGRS